MRPNSGDNQAKGLTLRNLVYKIANLILPVRAAGHRRRCPGNLLAAARLRIRVLESEYPEN